MTDKTLSPSSDTRETPSPPWEQFERERLTRRAALKKFGMTSGMAFFSMFAADDLARMVIKQMEQHQATRQVAETVAHEFKNAGIAFADSSSGPCYAAGKVGGDTIGTACKSDPYCNCDSSGTCASCVFTACEHYYPGGGSDFDTCLSLGNKKC